MGEDFGYEYKGGLETQTKTQCSFKVPVALRRRVFGGLTALARETGVKVITVGEDSRAADIAWTANETETADRENRTAESRAEVLKRLEVLNRHEQEAEKRQA